MELDGIVVICLALLFFGGIGYLAVKARKQEGDVRESELKAETPVTPPENGKAKEGRKKRKRRNR